MTSTFLEVELKHICKNAKEAGDIMDTLRKFNPKLRLIQSTFQKNHYYSSTSDLKAVAEIVTKILGRQKAGKILNDFESGETFDIRLREINGFTDLIIKRPLKTTQSRNDFAKKVIQIPLTQGYEQMEIEEIILDAGLQLSSRWSRQRKEFSMDGILVCHDINAGFGHVLCLESNLKDEAEINAAYLKLHHIFEHCGVSSTNTRELDVMFEYYEHHWQEYYLSEGRFLGIFTTPTYDLEKFKIIEFDNQSQMLFVESEEVFYFDRTYGLLTSRATVSKAEYVQSKLVEQIIAASINAGYQGKLTWKIKLTSLGAQNFSEQQNTHDPGFMNLLGSCQQIHLFPYISDNYYSGKFQTDLKPDIVFWYEP